MRRRLHRDPKDTPMAVLVGEFYVDRKREVAGMARTQLRHELAEAGIEIPKWGDDLLWMRLRLMYYGQVEFYAERKIEVPEMVMSNIKRLDTRPLPSYQPNIFFGAAER